MIHFLEVDVSGAIMNSCSGNVEDLDMIRPHYKGHLVEVSEPLEKPFDYYWDDPGVKPKGICPDLFHAWDWGSKSWLPVDSTERLKLQTDVVLNARRDAYPDIGDQLDVLWKELGSKAITIEAKAMADVIATVKLNNPKPN